VSIKNGPYKDTGYNGHNKTHDEDKQNKNAQHNGKIRKTKEFSLLIYMIDKIPCFYGKIRKIKWLFYTFLYRT
jgi:hypothetical protein